MSHIASINKLSGKFQAVATHVETMAFHLNLIGKYGNDAYGIG